MAECDVVILGGGTGGYVAAIRGRQLGLSVGLVEADKLGGTCLHRGCIPSKALLRSAEVLASARAGAAFGVVTDGLRFDLELAMERKRKVVEQLHAGVEFLMKKHGVQVIPGYGRVMGPSIFSPQAGAVRVGEQDILTPRATVIATGSRPRALAGLPFDGVRILSSDDALQLSQVPASVLIVGGGVIGIEWASMLADFGSDVTVVEALPRILMTEDTDIAAEMTRILKKRKVRIVTGATVDAASYREQAEGIAIDVRVGDSLTTLSASVMLVAVGRQANVDDIGLEATKVVVNRGVIEVDDCMRTAESGIYAIGDVIGRLQLAHVAAHEGIVAMEAIAGQRPHPLPYDDIARCTYSRPEVASVGVTEDAAVLRGHDVRTAKFQFRAIGKALVYGEPDGFVKLVCDATSGDLLGVHMIGPHVTDLISEAALARVLDATAWEIGQTIHPHPTLSEVLGEASLAISGMQIHG
jgi:dihydrolipoamide dehydrogenase